MENRQPEALVLASLFERCVIAFGETETSSRAIAAKELRRLHTRVEELEAMLDAVGAGGVSAQRVTQAADHIAQDRKMMTAQETNGLLARIEKEISTAQINNHRMAAPFGKMEGEPCVRISSLLATIEGFLNETTDALSAAPVVLPEPFTALVRKKSWLRGAYDAAPCAIYKDYGRKWADERVFVYTEQQVRALLAKDLDAVNIDRLGKALTKLGHATWVSREAAAADMPRWVNALTSCVLEIPEAAPQPQADGRDAERYLDYLIHNQARVCNNLDEYEGDEDCADCGYWLEFTDSNSQRWVQIGVFKNPRDAIDAAIVAAKEMK